jgi:hypothetical protein
LVELAIGLAIGAAIVVVELLRLDGDAALLAALFSGTLLGR